MTKKYLDNEGLTSVWNKIKNYLTDNYVNHADLITQKEDKEIKLNTYIKTPISVEKVGGNTIQEDTPTPDIPKDIKVVTNTNTININGKNFLNVDSEFTLKGMQRVPINLAKGKYILSCTDITNNDCLVSFNNSSDTTRASVLLRKDSKSKEIEITDSDVTQVLIYSSKAWSNSQSVTTTFTNLMLSKDGGDYEPYIGVQSFPLNLTADTPVNLFDKDNPDILNAYFESSGDTIKSSPKNTVIYVPCEPNKTYVVSRELLTDCSQIATTSEVPDIGVEVSNFRNIINSFYEDRITTGSDARYLLWRCSKELTDDITTLFAGIKIYEYFPTELCKMSGCQDYMYKKNNKWFFHKEIDVSENTVYGLDERYSNITYGKISKPIYYKGYNNYSDYPILCTHASYGNYPNGGWDDEERVGMISNSANLSNLWIGLPSGITLAEAQAKLAYLKFYYPLSTAIEVEITKTNRPTLYSQLNALEKAYSYANTDTYITVYTENETPTLSIESGISVAIERMMNLVDGDEVSY